MHFSYGKAQENCWTALTKILMTNRVAVVPIGDPAAAQDVAMAFTPDGSPIQIKNKYFEATLQFDFDSSGKPPAVLWVSHSKYTDNEKTELPKNVYEDAELRLLLRIVDETSSEEIPERLKDWEIDNYAEIVNVHLATLEEEIRKFHEGTGRTSLLDDQAQPAGCRILEALEMVNWPIKVSVGKPRIQQKIEALTQMLENQDPEMENFDRAMALMLELKSEIPNLPDEERHKYAAQVALAFQKILCVDGGEEEEEEEEAHENHQFQSIPSDDEELPQPGGAEEQTTAATEEKATEPKE